MLKKTISGDSFEAIAKRFGVTESSLLRHLENHVSKHIPAVTIQKDVDPKDISQVINESLAELEWAKHRAKEKDDIRAFTDTVKAKLNFCVRLAEVRNQQAMQKGDKVTAGEYDDLLNAYKELRLSYCQLFHVISMILTLPCGNFRDQYMGLMDQEMKSDRKVDFYQDVTDSVKKFVTEQPNIPDVEFYKNLTETIHEYEKDNKVYNHYKDQDDVYDILKLMNILGIQESYKTLLNKIKKYRATEEDLPKILELKNKLDAIDPEAKIRKKYKEKYEKKSPI